MGTARVLYTSTNGKDRWESSWIQRGWLVRVHRGQRKRSFQPIHRASPVAGGDLLPLRVTVGFEEDTNRRFVMTDRWDVEPANPVASRWTGWTFFRLKHVDGTAHDRALSQGSGGDARAEGQRSPVYLNAMELEYHVIVVRFSGKF